MENLISIAYALAIVAVFYFCLSVYCFYTFLRAREIWSPEFAQEFKKIGFKITLFWYSPISLTKRIMGEIHE